jgi:hypothetical protein
MSQTCVAQQLSNLPHQDSSRLSSSAPIGEIEQHRCLRCWCSVGLRTLCCLRRKTERKYSNWEDSRQPGLQCGTRSLRSSSFPTHRRAEREERTDAHYRMVGNTTLGIPVSRSSQKMVGRSKARYYRRLDVCYLRDSTEGVQGYQLASTSRFLVSPSMQDREVS